MRIQHNIMAMNAYRNYTNNTSALSKNLEKLSSGYKINRAGDDAAGLAISEKMRAQITGLEVAQKNAKDGISLVQTAEGALTEVHDMLNRMVELANQSANGTYDDSTDRANLQKEIQQLKSEIDRIADSSNFNGIKLLDGSLSTAAGIEVDGFNVQTVAAKQSGAIGALDKAVDGEKTAGTAEVKYTASFYMTDVTNDDLKNDKTLVFNYKDNNGGAQTVTLTIGAGETATVDDILAALNGTADGTNVKTVKDSGTAIGAAANGKLTDLFNVTKSSSNVITFEAKNANGAAVNGATIDSTKVGGVTVTGGDVNLTAENKELQEDYNKDGTAGNIAVGSASGEAKAYTAKTDGQYKVGSIELDLTGKTAADLHNAAITVGDKNYVIQTGDKAVETSSDANAVVVKINSGDTATQIAKKLAEAITAGEANNGGFVAAAAGDKLTISESGTRGQNILDTAGKTATKIADVVKLKEYTLQAGTKTTTGTIEFDPSKLANGTTVTVNGKTYMFSDDPKISTSGAGASATLIQYDRNSSAKQIADAFVSQLKTDNATEIAAGTYTVSTDGAGKVTISNTNVGADTFAVTTGGVGLSLQIGDTSDSFNRLNVSVQDMHSSTLGIGNIDVSTQVGGQNAVDLIKNAINTVSSVRGDLGATQNRLDHTINNLAVMTENIQDAEATIRDTDVAKEMMAYTKNNILVQSAQAMLAQANQVPQGVLQLLG